MITNLACRFCVDFVHFVHFMYRQLMKYVYTKTVVHKVVSLSLSLSPSLPFSLCKPVYVCVRAVT